LAEFYVESEGQYETSATAS